MLTCRIDMSTCDVNYVARQHTYLNFDIQGIKKFVDCSKRIKPLKIHYCDRKHFLNILFFGYITI